MCYLHWIVQVKKTCVHWSSKRDQLASEAVVQTIGPLADKNVSRELGDVAKRNRGERMLFTDRQTKLSVGFFYILLIEQEVLSIETRTSQQ
jgi:hypothetical protein